MQTNKVRDIYKREGQLQVIPGDMPGGIDEDSLIIKFHQGANKYYLGQWNPSAEKGQQREGFGIFINSNGGLYEGYWKQGKFKGFGRSLYMSCSIYQGEFDDGKRDGFGITINPNQKYTHKGYYKNGEYHGKGILNAEKDGIKYIGDFVEGKMTSKNATFCYSNGAVYKGSIK